MNKDVWDGWLKSAPRPLIKWTCLAIIPYMAFTPEVSESKFSMFLIFTASLYGIRGLEKGIKWVYPKETKQ